MNRPSLSTANRMLLSAQYIHATSDERDKASEARHGGRYYTQKLALAARAPGLREALAGEAIDAPDPVYENRIVWESVIDLYGGRDGTARVARLYAQGKDDFGNPKQSDTLTLKQAEAMVSWPVYRAAIAPWSELTPDPIDCWLFDNGWATVDDDDTPAGYMDGGPEQEAECRSLRGDATCPVHSGIPVTADPGSLAGRILGLDE